MKITNKDLNIIHDMALNNYMDNAHNRMTDTQFRTKCYVQAVVKFLKLTESVEFDAVKPPYEPAEE